MIVHYAKAHRAEHEELHGEPGIFLCPHYRYYKIQKARKAYVTYNVETGINYLLNKVNL